MPIIPGTGLFAAPDGRFLATGTGLEVQLKGGLFAKTGSDIPLIGPPGSWRAVDFADHDQALVATETHSNSNALVEIVSFDGHPSMALGDAQSVAGDPGALGVFAVTSGNPQSASSSKAVPAGIERRDAGAPPVGLATTSQLLSDLGDSAATALLSVLPNPQGDKVAVIVVPSVGDPPQTGIVVLGRTGSLIGTSYATASGVGRPAWSPNGDSLLYNASTPKGAAVAVWTIGHAPVIHTATRDTGAAGATFGNCLWAAGGNQVLCGESGNTQASTPWVTGRLGRAPLVVTHGPSLPFAWLSGRGD